METSKHETPELPVDVSRKLGDRYTGIEYIARGGSSLIFKAYDQILSKTIALKILHSQNEEELIRLQREARALSKLKHESIVTILDFDRTSSNKAFIIMEFIEGRTLAEFLEKEIFLQLDQALEIAASIAAAMSHAHSLGILHRDLKPSNIILPANWQDQEHQNHISPGRAKIIDFGLARRLEPSADKGKFYDGYVSGSQGKIQGSPRYMSPEQIESGHVDQRSDIYSLGCIIYRMLAGHVVFDSDDMLQVLRMHKLTTPMPLAEVAKVDIPESLQKLTASMLEKEPDSRPQSMDEVLAALNEINSTSKGNVEIQDSAQVSSRKTSTKSKKKRNVAITISLLVLVLLTASLVYLSRESEIDQNDKLEPPMLDDIEDDTNSLERSGFMKTNDIFMGNIQAYFYRPVYPEQISDDNVYLLAKFLKKEKSTDLPLKLSLSSTNTTEKSIEHLRDCNLQSLDLSSTDVCDRTFSSLASLHSLKKLSLSYCKLDEKKLKLLANSRHLEFLDLSDSSGVTSGALEAIAKMSSLKELVLENTKVTRQGLKALGSNQSLKAINLGNTGMDDEIIKEYTSLPNLKELRLNSNANISDTSLEIIVRKWPRLTCLAVANTSITNASLPLLAKLPELKELNIAGLSLDAQSLVAISTLRDLNLLHIRDKHLSDKALEHLYPLKKLRTIWLDSSGSISAEAIEKLKSRYNKPRLDILGADMKRSGHPEIEELFERSSNFE